MYAIRSYYVVRSAVRIQEKKRSSLSRKKELDYLGKWFYQTPDLATAHKLSAYVFGLFPTRHLQGEDSRESDSREIRITSYNVCYTKLLRPKGTNTRLPTSTQPAISAGMRYE